MHNKSLNSAEMLNNCIKLTQTSGRNIVLGGGGANPIFPIFPIPISEKSTFISGKSGNSFSPISPSLITLGHMLIHNFYINVLIALILVYRNSM